MTPSAPSKDLQAQSEPEPGASAELPARGASSKAARVAKALSATEAQATDAPAMASPTGFVSASHHRLFESEEPRCDACDGPLNHRDADGADGSLSADSDDDDSGHGLYIWVRHGKVTYEETPLCPSCAKAITISALQRWEIDEEEG